MSIGCLDEHVVLAGAAASIDVGQRFTGRTELKAIAAIQFNVIRTIEE